MWPPGVSTWMMWTSCSTATFLMKIRTMSTGSAVPAGPNGRVSFVADFPSKIRIDDIAKNTRNEILPVKFDENGSLTMA